MNELTKKEIMLAEMVIAQKNKQGFFIEVLNEDYDEPELIVNALSNVANKRAYYESAYTDDLKLVNNPKIAIVRFSAFTSKSQLPASYFTTDSAPWISRTSMPKGIALSGEAEN